MRQWPKRSPPLLSPTAARLLTYASELNEAYRVLNERLFSGELPDCLVTYRSRGKSDGFYTAGRFAKRDGSDVELSDEIGMNPQSFRDRTTEQILSTLLRMMCHCWEYRVAGGKASKSGYHTAVWADAMEERGLLPTKTGEEGGARVGHKMEHMIIEHGPFQRLVREMIANGFTLSYEDAVAPAERKKKSESKTTYNCVCGWTAWARPRSELGCGNCDAHDRAAEILPPEYLDQLSRAGIIFGVVMPPAGSELPEEAPDLDIERYVPDPAEERAAMAEAEAEPEPAPAGRTTELPPLSALHELRRSGKRATLLSYNSINGDEEIPVNSWSVSEPAPFGKGNRLAVTFTMTGPTNLSRSNSRSYKAIFNSSGSKPAARSSMTAGSIWRSMLRCSPRSGRSSQTQLP